jgi:cell division protease FtsH
MRFIVALLSILVNTGLISGFFINKPPFYSRIRLVGEENKNYPFSQKYFERYIKRLNSKNITEQSDAILNNNDDGDNDPFGHIPIENMNITNGRVRIIINKNIFNPFFQTDDENNEEDGPFGSDGPNHDDGDGDDFESYMRNRGARGPREPRGPMGSSRKNKGASSEHFEIVKDSGSNFQSVGGYDSVKSELDQCIDILRNTTKYARYNVRTPKGLIFEGPPGNGKTLLAKALAGEAKTNFIAVSGAEFQDKYVGVGPAKIRELFKLAKENTPCIIFIDEIDALGRSRSGNGESSSAERDNTLNELLVALDGFKNTSGVFVIGATNRADLLDAALLRPGRIDKRVFIGNPDEKTREAIIKIHSTGKPREPSVSISDLVDITSGFSGAQIENLLNEAMLYALRSNREEFTREDIDMVCNKILVGWQPNEHEFTTDIINHIAIHEMGHAIVGLLSKHHSKVTKVIINLSAPSSPGYTVFENSPSNIYTREALFEHLMILLGGRIAEEQFWGISVTTGAINDFEEVLKLAHKMITYYGMGEKIIYPTDSEKYKEIVDDEIYQLINDAYRFSKFIIERSKEFVFESAELLKKKKTVKIEELMELIHCRYPHLLDLKIH